MRPDADWTRPKDIKAQLQRLWDRGELLRDLLDGEPRFPLRLRLKGPDASDIADRFQAVRAWVALWEDQPPLRLEWRQTRHRVQGTQSLPVAAWLGDADAAIAWLGRHQDRQRFVSVVAATRIAAPALLPWLARRPLQGLDLSPVWPQLLAVVDWVCRHPRPAVYLRQVDLPGVHSKFIESHRGVLAELLDLALPAQAIDAAASGVTRFAARYGFLEKPVRIRFRVLDPDIRTLPGLDDGVCAAAAPRAPAAADIALDSDSFSRLRLDVRRVFITENEINFLAFPPVPGALVIFGGGYGWDALARSPWLNHCQIDYWGDIDTHGFGILDRLRGHFGHVRSFLMDRATLFAHESAWGRENAPLRADLPHLDPAEQALYDDLRHDRIRAGLRLEQEHIAFAHVQNTLRSSI